MPVSKINFKAQESTGNQKPEVIKLHKLDDETLKNIAWQKHQSNLKAITNNSAKVCIVAVPAVDIFLSGLASKGNLASKLGNSLKTAGNWGAVLGAGLALLGVKKSINSHSEKLRKLDSNHPVISTIADVTALCATYSATLFGARKVLDFAKTKYAKKISNLDAVTKISLNNSVVNRKFVQPLENYLSKKPYSAKALKTVAVLAAPVMLVASYARFVHEAKKSEKEANLHLNQMRFLNNMLPEKESV